MQQPAQNLPPVTPELGALAELLALIDACVDLGVIDLSPPGPLDVTSADADDARGRAIDELCEAMANASALVTQRLRARAAQSSCPYPILGDRDAAECVANGHCGCSRGAVAIAVPNVRSAAAVKPTRDPTGALHWEIQPDGSTLPSPNPQGMGRT